MSYIIELKKSSPKAMPEEIPRIITTIFRQYDATIYNGQSINMLIGTNIYRLPTKWEIIHNEGIIIIKVKFIAQNVYLRAKTQRSKLECSIMLRMYQKTLHPHHKFLMETDTGTLMMELFLNIKQIPKASLLSYLKQCTHYLFQSFTKVDEAMMFLEPGMSNHTSNQNQMIYSKLNRYRCFLKDNINRRNLHKLMGELYEGKNLSIPEEYLGKVRKLYQNNVMAFHKSQIGVEEAISESEQLQEEHQNISTLKSGKFKSNKGQKIVSGISRMKVNKQSIQKISEGSHCYVYSAYLQYTTVDTIAVQTVNFALNDWQQNSKAQRGQLTYKQCKDMKNQASKNSFMNEIQVLKYLKEDKCSYIAKYFLELKQNWNENDYIYMKMYKANLYTLFQKHSSSLSIKERLKLAYQIGRSLCFLSSKDIAHRDFKPQNLMVDKNLKIHVIDFGSAAPYHNSAKFQVKDERLLTASICHVKWNHLSPEDKQNIYNKFDSNAYNKHRLFDVMGFGRILSYMFFGNVYPPCLEALQYEGHYEILENIYFLVNLCLRIDPDDRPAYSQITAFVECLRGLIPYSMEESKDYDQL